MMDDNDIRAITVVDGDGKPLGFVKRREARGAQGDCAGLLHPFRITGKAEDNLRVVLSRCMRVTPAGCRLLMKPGATTGRFHRIILRLFKLRQNTPGAEYSQRCLTRLAGLFCLP
jgi:hypothetical protein